MHGPAKPVRRIHRQQYREGNQLTVIGVVLKPSTSMQLGMKDKVHIN